MECSRMAAISSAIDEWSSLKNSSNCLESFRKLAADHVASYGKSYTPTAGAYRNGYAVGKIGAR